MSACRSECFFFQAEDGIRDIGVTGVQTCALPIFIATGLPSAGPNGPNRPVTGQAGLSFDIGSINTPLGQEVVPGTFDGRSEERRVGKACRSRWSPYH